jgi:hypothetical protein
MPPTTRDRGPRRYTSDSPGERAPGTGESDQSHLDSTRWNGGTSSIAAIADAIVPPGKPPLIPAALVLAPSGALPSVCEARYTLTSAGTESIPQEGTIIARIFVAR